MFNSVLGHTEGEWCRAKYRHEKKRRRRHKTVSCNNTQNAFLVQLRTCENFRVLPNTFLYRSYLLFPLHPVCTFLSILQALILSVLLHISLPIIFTLASLHHLFFFPHFCLISSPSSCPSLFPMLASFFLFLHNLSFSSSRPPLQLSVLFTSAPPPPSFFLTPLRSYTPPFRCAGRVVDARGGLKGVKAES